MKKIILVVVVLSFICGCYAQLLFAQRSSNPSGGPILYEQAAYNVTYYDLNIRIHPDQQIIGGTLTTFATIVHPTKWFVLDLDKIMAVNSVKLLNRSGAEQSLAFERKEGKIWIPFTSTKQPGEQVIIKVDYGGNKGSGGNLMWRKTPNGDPWIAVACQMNGGDVWWPCKDHSSDEPDSMAIHITVPKPLIVASNGRLRKVSNNKNNSQTYHWFVSTPINNYLVTLNIAPYIELKKDYQSVTGETIPATFWALRENEQKARAIFPEFLDHLRFFEELLGPYPFRADKYGVAEVPYLGMEHQTIIAYGADYKNDPMSFFDWGFDGLHQHELAHEWFGNLVTPLDWRDAWLNEGFGEYMQALYAESRIGKEKAQEIMAFFRSQVDPTTRKNDIVMRESVTAGEAWSHNIYMKGACVLHTLRYVIGDAKFKTLLRRWIYPDPEMEKITDGSQCRFVTVEDFIQMANKISEMNLDWFFNVYLYQADLPSLRILKQGNKLRLRWNVRSRAGFPMPIDIQLGDKIKRIKMTNGRATVNFDDGIEPKIDPDKWILMEKNVVLKK